MCEPQANRGSGGWLNVAFPQQQILARIVRGFSLILEASIETIPSVFGLAFRAIISKGAIPPAQMLSDDIPHLA